MLLRERLHDVHNVLDMGFWILSSHALKLSQAVISIMFFRSKNFSVVHEVLWVVHLVLRHVLSAGTASISHSQRVHGHT